MIRIDSNKEQDSTLTDVLAFAGHELRNQVAVIQLASAKLENELDGAQNEKQAMIAKRIRRSAATVERIARRYLQFAQISDQQFVPFVSLIDPIQDVIEPILFLYADHLKATGQLCRIELARPDLLVWADLDLLTGVFENLLNNAIKYGDDGGTILIKLVERSSEVEISIWNSGRGIIGDELDVIFDRFTRGKEAIDKKGSGIGLYLVKRIVEAHGGRIWCESKPDKWACFTFTLPNRGHRSRLNKERFR